MSKYVICAWFDRIEGLIWTDLDGGSWYVEPRDEDNWEMVMFDSEEEATKYMWDMGLFEIPIQREFSMYVPIGVWKGIRTIYPDVEEGLSVVKVHPVGVDECL